MTEPVDLAAVHRAADALRGHVVRTPAATSLTLSEQHGCEVVLKLENLQFTASFKERGALNKLLHLPPETTGVVAMSAGNHAQGLAYHAGRFDLPVTIVMPRATPLTKVERTEVLGARIVLHGDDVEQAQVEALRLAAAEGLTFVPPFDDPHVIAGQGTVGVELLEDHPDLDAILVPIGGGGLASGVGVAASAVDRGVEIVGVQTRRYPWAALRAARTPQVTETGPTIAEGIAVGRPGALTASLVDTFVDDVVTVSEGRIESAIAALLDLEKVVSEGAGAAGLAAIASDPARWRGRKVGLIVSGGNIDLRILAQVITRSLTRNGRICHVRVRIPDVPLSLGRVTTLIGEAGANILDVTHDRYEPRGDLRSALVDVLVETRGEAHAAAVVAALGDHGFDAELAAASEP